MNVDETLGAAMQKGNVVRGPGVNESSYSEAARTYLADGTGLAWETPARLRTDAVFAVDAELIAPIRPSLCRYGVADPEEFAHAWTRAEVWAKLFDTPIIIWLSRHGLTEPDVIVEARHRGVLAWSTTRSDDLITTFGARQTLVVGGPV